MGLDPYRKGHIWAKKYDPNDGPWDHLHHHADGPPSVIPLPEGLKRDGDGDGALIMVQRWSRSGPQMAKIA